MQCYIVTYKQKCVVLMASHNVYLHGHSKLSQKMILYNFTSYYLPTEHMYIDFFSQ